MAWLPLASSARVGGGWVRYMKSSLGYETTRLENCTCLIQLGKSCSSGSSIKRFLSDGKINFKELMFVDIMNPDPHRSSTSRLYRILKLQHIIQKLNIGIDGHIMSHGSTF